MFSALCKSVSSMLWKCILGWKNMQGNNLQSSSMCWPYHVELCLEIDTINLYMRLWFCTKIELDYLNALAYSQKLFTMIVYFMNMVIREQCQAQTCLNKITALSTYIIDANTEFRSKLITINISKLKKRWPEPIQFLQVPVLSINYLKNQVDIFLRCNYHCLSDMP